MPMSVPLCSLFRVPIRVHVLLPAVCVVAAITAGLRGYGFWGVLFAVLVNGPLLLATVWVHEMGHVTAARRCGFVPEYILLWPLGGLAYISKAGITPREQICVSVSGPLTHLPMIGLWMGLLFVFNGGKVNITLDGMSYQHDFVAAMCIVMLVDNIAMLLFNLLVPCIPLDCSQILVSVLLLCGMEAGAAAKTMVFVSIPIVGLLLAYGVYCFFSGIAMASLTIVMALWLGLQTYRLWDAQKQGALSSIPLFASAMAMDMNGKSAGGGSRNGNFKAFEGQGHTLGKSTTAPPAEVCLAALVTLSVNLVAMSYLG